MPQHKSPKKRLKQNAKREARNNFVKKTIKTSAKKMHDNELAVDDKKVLLNEVYSQLDKAAKKGVIHSRTASRRKSRIAAYLNKLEG
jgi:small subunit ribosomal protein S20